MKKTALILIDCYQKWVSPLLPPSCVFYPTCSVYAKEAIQKHGVLKGTGLAARRILRCHPWQKNRIDPVR